MAIIIGGARHDENGNYTGGKAGDQLQSGSGDDYKGECSMCDFYVHKYGWYILRAREAALADKLAERMIALCNNAHVGYDQGARDGIIKYGIDTKTDTECDCSSGVRECIKEASGTDPGDFTTGTEVTALEKTGLFEDKIAYKSGTTLYTGDILVSQQKGHTVIVCYGSARSGSGTSSSGSGSSSSGSTSSSTKDSYDESLAGTYTVTANSGLNVRKAAGSSSAKVVAIPKNTSVKCDGHYQTSGSTKWLYITFTYNNKSYSGYATSSYLKKASSSSSSSSSGSSSSSSSKKPSYKVGTTYKTQVDRLNVRTGAGTNYSTVSYKNLSSNAKIHAYSNGSLQKGTAVTCKAVKEVGSDIWIQIPSGWIAAYYKGETYVS